MGSRADAGLVAAMARKKSNTDEILMGAAYGTDRRPRHPKHVLLRRVEL